MICKNFSITDESSRFAFYISHACDIGRKAMGLTWIMGKKTSFFPTYCLCTWRIFILSETEWDLGNESEFVNKLFSTKTSQTHPEKNTLSPFTLDKVRNSGSFCAKKNDEKSTTEEKLSRELWKASVFFSHRHTIPEMCWK